MSDTWSYAGQTGYLALKARDAALDPPLADPGEAAAAIGADVETVTLDVAATDMRAVLWPTLEYAGLVLLSRVQSFSTEVPEMLVRLAITAVSLLDSGRTIAASDTAAWQAFMGGVEQFVATHQISQASADALARCIRMESSRSFSPRR
jgi:hypothetical protein